MNIDELKKQLRPLNEKTADCPAVNSYLRFYGLDLANETIKHQLGTFKSGEFMLCGHIFQPADYKATVIILHGYLGHCGLLSKLIKYLVELGFAVAVFDLPGHGLSGGERTAIDDFTQYSESLDDFLKIIKTKLHGPYHIIGHSTGAAIIVDYLLAGCDDSFDKVILAAPLERSDWWLLSKIGFSISRHFCDFLPRVFRRVSSDKDFLRFVKYEDPLQAKKISLKWVGAVFRWDEKITDAKTSPRPTLTIQGTKDNIVAWKYNLKFIQSKFGNTQIKLVENCGHELFNESQEVRAMVFSQIKDYLEQ
ncbi:MAG: alpha/beta hydrolase [Phycisphaerae bacterium]|jgi:alpha-beta hydrolase superfamily lysophospholipase